MRIRIALNIIMFFSVLFFPIWLSISLAVFFLLRYRAYELVAWGFFVDTLYGTPLFDIYGLQLVVSVAAAVSLLVVEILKKYLIFYRHVV